jgi:hypothetical protein
VVAYVVVIETSVLDSLLSALLFPPVFFMKQLSSSKMTGGLESRSIEYRKYRLKMLTADNFDIRMGTKGALRSKGLLGYKRANGRQFSDGDF